MARHLHEQSGGNPRDQGPVPELANEPRSPRADEDFPDAPEHDDRPRRGGDLTDEQLDDFASRLGLTEDPDADPDDANPHDTDPDDAESDDVESDAGSDDRRVRRVSAVVVRRVRVVRRPVGRVMIVVARAASGTGDWLRSRGERLQRPMASDR